MIHFFEKLCLDQVDLPEVRLPAEPLDVKKVLIIGASMSIALDAEVFDAMDRIFWGLTEDVVPPNLHAEDLGCAIFVEAGRSYGVRALDGQMSVALGQIQPFKSWVG